jgi:hypothetical protein
MIARPVSFAPDLSFRRCVAHHVRRGGGVHALRMATGFRDPRSDCAALAMAPMRHG